MQSNQSSRSGKLNLPPADSSHWHPVIKHYSGVLFRNHYLNKHPLHFSQEPTHRFNAPNKEFGVCYFGTDLECCFTETFLHDGMMDITTTDLLSSSSLASFNIPAPLHLLDLSGGGALRIGADQQLLTIIEPTITQAWSLYFYTREEKFDGIYYTSRTNAKGCVALFERAKTKLNFIDTHTWLSERYFVDCLNILKFYNIELIDPNMPVNLQ